MTKVYDRKLKKVIDTKHFGGSKLDKIYKSKILTYITTSKLVSKLYGLYNGSFLSKKKINKFISDNNIDMNLYENKEYKSFNDFFIRKLNKISFDKEAFISPCSGKLLVYKIEDNLKVNIKNVTYSLEELFNTDISSYKDGYMFVYRLALNDYHRFHYIDDGKRLDRKIIKGRLHTVSDSSRNYKVFKENEREYSILDLKHFGKVIYMEVGALLVGKIINYDYASFKRGEEKGYFLPGGSTIVIVCNNIKVDKDILKYSSKDIETIVNVGDKVGEKIC